MDIFMFLYSWQFSFLSDLSFPLDYMSSSQN